MDSTLIYSFLKDLAGNNSLDWMEKNRAYYEQAKREWEQLIGELLAGIQTFDNSITILPPKEYMFKLNRDTRFSKDKSPYNSSFRAHISKTGRQPVPVGYYVCVKPKGTFLGGGLFVSMFSGATKSVRDYIVKNGNKLKIITEAPDFINNFVIDGEKLKNIPKEYDGGHEFAEYLKHKSWYLEYSIKDHDFLYRDKFVKTSVTVFKYMKPFNDFLNSALKNFEMPRRAAPGQL